MAFATCRSCHRGANESPCPRCGGVMFADEIFEPDEGGAYPQLGTRRPAARSAPEHSDFWEAAKEERLAEAIRVIEKKLGRPAMPLEKAIASIEAHYGKGSMHAGK